MNVLIIDDHEIVRAGLKQILAESKEYFFCTEAANAMEAFNVIKNNAFNLILLDISLPDKSGIEILKKIRLEDPKVPVLILSVYPEEQYAVRALKAGANGYMTKESASGELLKAIRKVLAGGKYISETLGEKLALSFDNGDSLLHETLSDREFDLLKGIASGKTVSSMAEELHLSVKTISTYRTRLLKKMGMRQNAELTRYAISEGLIE